MVLLINPFTVFDGHEARFLELWDMTGEVFRRSDGYISARLCQASERQPFQTGAPYTHVNVAEWESDAHYRAAVMHPQVRALAPEYAKVCTFSPALYEVIRDQERG